MKAAKDTSLDERAAVELSNTVQLAVEALDGRQLSDDELEELCDTVLSEPIRLVSATKP